MRLGSVLFCFLLLQGCTYLAVKIGATSATLQTAQTADATKAAVDATSVVGTERMAMDHVTGWIRGKDCNTFRLFTELPVCIGNDQPVVLKYQCR